MKHNDPTLQEQVNYLANQARKALATDLVIILAQEELEGGKGFGLTGISGRASDTLEIIASAVVLLGNSIEQLMQNCTDGSVTVVLRTDSGEHPIGHSECLSFVVKKEEP